MPLPAWMIKAVHQDLRAFFKGQVKSSNKLYRMPDAKEIPPHIRQRRHDNSLASHHHLIAMREKAVFAKENLSQYGRRVLAQDKPRAGNCIEVTAAAALLVKQRKIGTPWIAHVMPPADHAFCYISDGSVPGHTHIFSLKAAPADAWVIDAWANICCPANQYTDALVAELMNWGGRGKSVLTYIRDAPTTPPNLTLGSDYDYIFRLISAPVLFELLPEAEGSQR